MNTWAGMALINLSTLGWATNLTLARWVSGEVGPLTLSALRYSVAALIFWALMRRLPPAERRLGRDRWLLLGMALSGITIFSPLVYWGLHYTTAANAALINGTGPLLTAIWAVWLIREPMTPRQTVGAVLALAGVVILVSGGSVSYLLDFNVNFGDVLILVAVALWGSLFGLGTLGNEKKRAFGRFRHRAFHIPEPPVSMDRNGIGDAICFNAVFSQDHYDLHLFRAGPLRDLHGGLERRRAAPWAPAGPWSSITHCLCTARLWGPWFWGNPWD